MQRKITSFGLVIYVLILLTQPCQDVFAHASQLDQGATSMTRVDTPSDSEPESETCSPFCICGCCSLSVAHHTFSTIETSEIVIEATPASPSIYRDPYDATYLTIIWQPPKV